MSRLWVFGLSGMLGRALRPHLPRWEGPVIAISRQVRPAEAGIDWRQGDLCSRDDWGLRAQDTVLSLGPLDHFVAALAVQSVLPERLLLIGSTSIHLRARSGLAHDAELVRRLAQAERTLHALAVARGLSCLLLRPTLLYGDTEDGLARPARFAARWGFLPFPSGSHGLRQPVHVAEIAELLARHWGSDGPRGSYDLPGGEAVSLEALIRRGLAARGVPARLLPLPGGLLERLADWSGNQGLASSLLRRNLDQTHDVGPATCDLGWAPGPFRP
jgi:nucleoside-diphosphate-sugar epimerase